MISDGIMQHVAGRGGSSRQLTSSVAPSLYATREPEAVQGSGGATAQLRSQADGWLAGWFHS